MSDPRSRTSSKSLRSPHARPAVAAAKRAALSSNSGSEPARAKLLLVDFRSGEAVRQHPDVAPLLKEGWSVTGAAPRVTSEGTRLFVVLAPPGASPALTTRRFDAPAG